jgi:ribosomal protein S18 acetylase RimI-like enzyme
MKNKVQNPIRPARPEDIPALKHIVEATDMFPPEMLDNMIAGFLAGTTDQEYWLVVDDQVPAALAFYRMEEMTIGTWNLLLLAVDPDHHGKGMGSELLRHVEEHLMRLRQRVLLIETSGTDAFAATRAFYDRHGYSEEAVIRDYYDKGDDKVVFRKTLQD